MGFGLIRVLIRILVLIWIFGILVIIVGFNQIRIAENRAAYILLVLLIYSF